MSMGSQIYSSHQNDTEEAPMLRKKTIADQSTIAALALLGMLAIPLGIAPARAAQHDAHVHHHHAAPAADGYRRSQHAYTLPRVTLVREDGSKAAFPAELDDGRPVALNFIYTSCTAVCPVLSQTFAGFEERLGAEAGKVRMVSVSIDPEHDTPARLADYAKRHGAGAHWRHYTGTPAASVAVQKAFAAYYGDKMNHRPTVFLRAAPGQPWVRLDGFMTGDELFEEFRRLKSGR